MKIPVYSSTIRRKEMDAVLSCLVSEKLGPGEFYIKLIQIVKDLRSPEYSVAFRSPAIALKYIIKALDLPLGSGIVISALAPLWQYKTILDLGFLPIVADVESETAVMSLESVGEGIKQGGRLIILHEPLGFMPDVSKYMALDIPIIEDISTSIGAINGDQSAGQLGTFTLLGLEERDLVTGGGGAIVMANTRREAIVLKKVADEASVIELLSDVNSALAYIQIKEFARNSELRRDIHALYVRSLMQGRHKTLSVQGEGTPSWYAFPVLLSSGLKEVRQYTNRKEIEIEGAFVGSVAEYLGDSLDGCIQAKSLLMRCVLFPLYPRLGSSNAAKIAKVLATLP